jgi:hypothetical protein
MASANKRGRFQKAAAATKAVVPSGTFRRYSDNIRTHEGGFAQEITDLEMLRRAVLSCFLWEDQYYESGKDIGDRIAELVPKVDPQDVFDLAVEAKDMMKLRHVPLLLATEMTKHPEHKKLVRKLCYKVIQRADELAEILAIYWRNELDITRSSDGKYMSQRAGRKIPMQLKRGIQDAFTKFDQYQLLRWQEKGSAVSLRDVIRIVHPNPTLATRQSASIPMTMSEAYSGIVAQTANAPDTWNVELSARGKAEKREVFTEQLAQRKLGATALLMNLRNMVESGVDQDLVRHALNNINVERILPFRFITAARYAPDYKPELETAMFKCLEGVDKLPGKTVLLVDISGSMGSPMSRRKDGRASDLRRVDAAAGLCILAQNICEDTSIYLFDTSTYRVSDRSIERVHTSERRGWYGEGALGGGKSYPSNLVGFTLAEAISNAVNGGTDLAQAVNHINKNELYNRLIIFHDDESATTPQSPIPTARGYSINVASGNNGVTYGEYNHISGFSENVLYYIAEYEKQILHVT